MNALSLLKFLVPLLLLAACSTRDSISVSAPTQRQIDKATLDHVDTLIKSKKYREAELLLTRESQKYPSDFVVQSWLLLVNSTQAKESLLKSDFHAAGADIDAADIALNTMKLHILSPEVSLPKNFEVTIKGQEDELSSIKSNLNRSVDRFCKKQLAAADAFAEEAKSLVTKNDRDMIIAGLVEVRKCNEFGKWASPDTKGKSTNSTRKLLNLATEEEKELLLRSAGFGFNE